MFEVLLQADRALVSGELDQAERSYWQLVELDPTNAIAVAGLARVALQRGDSRLARTLADRALEMDPDMAIAKRIRDTIAGASTEPLTSDQTDLPLLAAQRLEALGRRRAPASEEEEPDRQPSDSRGRAAKSQEQDDEAGAVADPLRPAAAEPPSERRQAGRLAAAAAAAGAAAEGTPRSQTQSRYKAHQALGDRVRRNLVPDGPKPRPLSEDPFAAAESAAAIEAVDQTDDVVFEERVARSGRAGRVEEQEADPVGDALGAVEARGQEESIAMRVALMAGATELPAPGADSAGTAAPTEPDAAELDVTEMADTEQDAAGLVEDVLGVAELVASEEFGAVPPAPIDLDALEAQLQAAEERASAREAGGQSDVSPKRGDPARGRARQTTGSGPASSSAPLAPDATEAEAEADALQEALDIVREGRQGAADPASAPPDPSEPTDTAAQPRRKGLFRRLRGD
jgi:hypothetical protein